MYCKPRNWAHPCYFFRLQPLYRSDPEPDLGLEPGLDDPPPLGPAPPSLPDVELDLSASAMRDAMREGDRDKERPVMERAGDEPRAVAVPPPSRALRGVYTEPPPSMLEVSCMIQ